MFGQKRTIVEDGSRWAVNPRTFQRGYICFGDGNKVLGEQLVPVSQPMPDVTELPDMGFEWQEQWAVNMKCLTGADAGIEVVFKTDDRRRHPGRRRADRGGARPPQRRPARRQGLPIVLLEKDSYPHSQYGKIWIPVLTIVDWMPLDGPAPAPAPPPPPSPPSSAAEQPRRRRVG